MKPKWRLKFRLLFAKLLIKLGKLPHAQYSSAELTELANRYLPETFKIDVPVSKGELTLLSAQINMPKKKNLINVLLFSSVLIGPPGKPIYRAHINISIEVYPIYDTSIKTVKVEKMRVGDVRLVNDEYAIIEDSRDLLSILFPKTLQNLVSGTMKSAFGLITAGGSDLAADYLKLYLSGSKKRILDYHRPQIEALVHEFSLRDDLKYQLSEEDFEEHLFCLYGKAVVVKDGSLKFMF